MLPMLMMVPPRLGEVPDSGPAAVDHAPEVGVEQPLLVFHRHVGELAVNRHAGVVHPGIESAELANRVVGDAVQIFGNRDVGNDVGGAAAADRDVFRGHAQIVLVARRQDDAGAAARRHPRRRQPDAAGRAGDHDHLIAQPLRFPATSHQSHELLLAGSESCPDVQRPRHAPAEVYNHRSSA